MIRNITHEDDSKAVLHFAITEERTIFVPILRLRKDTNGW